MHPSQLGGAKAGGGGDGHSCSKAPLRASREPQAVMPRSGWIAVEGGGGGDGHPHSWTPLGVSRNPQAAMASSGGEGSDSSSHDAGGESVAIAPASVYDYLTKPCFEGFWKGAWWDVQITQWRSNMFLVVFKDLDEENAWVSIDNLRLQARRCREWDCPILIRGMDVSVYDVHPQARDTTTALYDAKICFVKKSNHQGTCQCEFFVKFYSINAQMSLAHGVDRQLVETDNAKGVNHSSLFILQQHGMTPPDVLLKAHILEDWDLEQDYPLTSDAYFLNETKILAIHNFSRYP